jgi:hypothetical protein
MNLRMPPPNTVSRNKSGCAALPHLAKDSLADCGFRRGKSLGYSQQQGYSWQKEKCSTKHIVTIVMARKAKADGKVATGATYNGNQVSAYAVWRT